MKYVMSDIHGCYGRFQEMLSVINLRSEDKLIIIGDAIDRGKHGVKVLRHIMETPNIKFLLGNHELMLIESDILDKYDWSDETKKTNRENWINDNRGYYTMRALWDSPNHGADIINYLESVLHSKNPIQGIVETDDGRCFAVCHGWPVEPDKYNDAYTIAYHILWDRPERCSVPILPKNCTNPTLIIGHTPVNFLYTLREGRTMDHYRILHAPHFIDIDCGCGHSDRRGRLACLCLDTMEEFYI